MTDVHDTSELLNPVDVGTERSALRSEDNLNPLGISFEQQHDDGIDAQHREAAGTNLPHREVAQIAIGASHQKIPRYSKSSVEDALTTSRVERWSSCITPTLNGRSSRHDALQDARSDPYFPPNFLSQDCNSDARPLKSAQGAKDDFLPGRECRATRECSTPRLSWLNGNIIFICSLSTALSASFAFLAMRGQRYGDYVGNHPKAGMSISTAIIWTSVVAKTIELSFVTGVVALLGQVLSRRALINSSQGVTLYELTMWRWIVQPGTLVTTTTARYAGISVLGVLTLLCTILSTVYGTAATALVQPVPRQSDWHSKTMVGSVTTDFANYEYIESLCPSPIPDKEYANVTCLQLDWAGTNYYNFGKFLSSWGDMVKSNKGTSMKQEQRPTWIGLPYANTTVVPQWIDVVDTTEMSKKNQRVINSVSLALPHIGVSNAVSDMRNDMPRSDTSDVIKAYSLWASVPSPVMRVLCVHMNETELAPIVYGAWNNDKLNATEWTETPGKQDATTTNMTVVDELFGWTKKDNESMLDYPPVFAKYPKPFNTIFNHTFNSWERPAIYLLGQGGSYYGGKNLTGQYPLCKLEMDISARCSTVHSVSVSGSKVKALCDDRAADMAYFKTQPNATTIRNVSGWKKFGLAWVNSLSLQTGMEDAEATSARNFMQLQLDSQASDVKLDPLSPSLAETLAITASYSLLMSFEDAPFVHYWNHSDRAVQTPDTQCFKAKIQSQEYASGGADNASKGWLFVLISTFLLNALMLVYFVLQPGLVTDFSQPPQLFALAVNSPPSRALAGSCGAGPEGEQYEVGWVISREEGHLYIEPGSREESQRITDKPDSALVVDCRTSKGTRLLSSISTAFGHLNFGLKSRTKGHTRVSSASSTTPLQPQRSTESATSLQSQYELGEIGSRAASIHQAV